MTSRILPSALLTTAQRLAQVGTSQPGRPARSDLRRATSTAYYALFAQITRHGALDTLPVADEDAIARLARWFTHTGIKKVCDWVVVADRTHGSAAVQIPKASAEGVATLQAAWASSGPPPDLVTVATSFVELQEARHRADYDGLYDPTRPKTGTHIDLCDQALRSARRLWTPSGTSDSARREASQAYGVFLRLALAASGGPRAR